MEQTGEHRIKAGREQVWAALNNPEVLAGCIEGTQSFDKIDDTHFDVAVKAKVGPVSATFNGSLVLSELNPPASYVIHGSAKGGAAGFAKGSASVSLQEIDEGTLLRYSVDANVGGKLAQLGSRLIESAARKMADDFFTAFTASVVPSDQTDSTNRNDTVVSRADVAGRDSKETEQWVIWAIAFGVLVMAAVLTI